jgi:hypothetical protein
MTIEHQQSDPKRSLETMMRELHPQWNELGEGERSQLLVQWFRDFLKTDEAQPVRQELGLEDDAVPINWITRESLALCRPDLAEKIELLNEEEMHTLAHEIGDAQEQFYQMTASTVLSQHFGVTEPDEAL